MTRRRPLARPVRVAFAILFPFAAACGLAELGAGDGLERDPPTSPDAARVDDDAASDTGTPGPSALPPTIRETSPTDTSTDVSSATAVSVTFSEPMQPASLEPPTFELTQGDSAVLGSATYADNTLTFTPAAPLVPGQAYVASVSTAARDLSGTALLASHSWVFTTSATGAHGPAPVALKTAAQLTILAKARITNTRVSAIGGNVGLSPAFAASLTGFTLVPVGARWSDPQVLGSIFTADNVAPTPATLSVATADMDAAYTDAVGRQSPTAVDLGGGVLGGMVVAPGLYSFTGAVSVATEVVLTGGPNDVFILQLGAALDLAAGARITLRDGALARNVYWQVLGAVNLGAGAHAEGIVLARGAITLGARASAHGRLLGQTDVVLDSATVTPP